MSNSDTTPSEPTDAQVLASLNAWQRKDHEQNAIRRPYQEADNLEDWGPSITARMRAALSAAGVSPPTPSEPHCGVERDTVMGGVACSECGWHLAGQHGDFSEDHRAHFAAPVPSEGEREGLEHRMVLAKIVSEWGAALYTMEETVDRLAALTPPAPVDREKLNKAAAIGATHRPILAWGGGAVPEPMGEVCSECGDGPCTADAELDALAVSPAPARDEWEGR